MSILALVVLVAFLVILLAIGLLLLPVVAARLRTPTTKKKEAQQAQINKKLGRTAGYGEPKAETYDKSGQVFKWIGYALGIIAALVVVGALFAYFPVKEAPTLAETWRASKTYWLWILLLCLALFIAGSAWKKGDGKDGKKEDRAICKILHGFALGTLVFLFIVVPLLADIFGRSPGVPSSFAPPVYLTPSISWPKENWPQVTLPPYGNSELISVPVRQRIFVDGRDFSFTVLYMDGHECTEACGDGPIAGLRIRNISATGNTVSYAFGPL